MGYTGLLASQRAAVVGIIDPDAYAAGTYKTVWVNMEYFETLMFIVQAGDLGSSATLDARVEQATDSSGTSAKNVTGKSITQLTQAGTDSNKQAIINLVADEMDVTNSFTHARLYMTVGTATSDAGAIVLGLDPHYGPANDNDLSSVDEIVA